MSGGPTYINGATGIHEPVELPTSPDLDDVIAALVAYGIVAESGGE